MAKKGCVQAIVKKVQPKYDSGTIIRSTSGMGFPKASTWFCKMPDILPDTIFSAFLKI